jgi:hypothetical protein
MKSFILVIFLFFINVASFGQSRNNIWNSVYSTGIYPLGVLPMEYNSSFAGQAGSPRLNTAFKYSTRGSLETSGHRSWNYAASYDQFIPAISSGISVTTIRSATTANFSNNTHPPATYNPGELTYLNNNMVSVAIAPKIPIKGKYTLSPALDLNYHYVDFQNTPFISVDEATFTKSIWQSRASLLFNTDKYYIGLSTYLLNPPLGPEYNTVNIHRFARNATHLQMGYVFRRSEESNFSFTPQVVLAYGLSRRFTMYPSAGYNYFPISVINLNFMYKQVSWGVNNTGLHLGWQTNNFRIMASGNTISGGPFGRIYTGNIAVRYVFASNTKSLF